MATVNFLYRSTKENNPFNVRLLFREEGKDFLIEANSKISVYSRDELIENPKLSAKEFWKKFGKKKPKDLASINKKNGLDEAFNKLTNVILNAFEKISYQNATKEWLQSVIDEYYNPNAKLGIPDNVIEFIDYYLSIRTDLKYGTTKKFQTVKNKLINNLDKFGNAPILMSDINDNFRLKYNEVFSNYNTNTISRDLTEIKTLCKFAADKGLIINKEVFKWSLKIEKTVIVYLNEEDLLKIENKTDLPEYLDNARDWLLISCYTAQRISDFMRFDKSMIRTEKNKQGKKVQLIEFTQQKTNSTIAVPLHQKVLNILEKRNGEFPRPISDQKYNDYIKEVCKAAEINERIKGSIMVETEKDSGIYRKKPGVYEKWELVTSHIGRRSFASNYFGVIPTRLIMSATGHTKEDMFMKYIGKTQTEQAKELANWF